MAAPGASGPGSASNPRKFSEKIALQRQRQAEETAAFEEVMMDIGSTRLQVQKLRMSHMRGSYYGGSLPNVNQISGSTEFQGPPQSPLDPRSTRHHGLVERVQHRDPRRMMSPLRRYMRQVDSSPYGASYLSPHQEASWRRNLPWGNYPSDTGQLFRLPSALNRTSSDSALHTSVMNPASQEPYPGPPQGAPTSTRRSAAFPFGVPAIEESQADGAHLLTPCDARKLPSASARPKSCEVPGINIYPSVDQPASAPTVTSILNTGGSLPDLTNLHFPSPLPTPLDPDESGFSSLSGGSSTGNLTSTMTHLGIGRIGLPPGFDSSGFPSSAAVQNSLNRQSLQSSLSNPNLQTSISSASLQTSYSNPSLQSSLSSQSLPSSLSNQSLSPSASSHSLPSAYSTPSSPSSSSSSSFPPLASTSLNTSPRRRVPLSPLTLPISGDSRRPHQKQFSPTMSPTLTSITQGVPLDTSKMPAEQRLPPYHYNHPNLLHHSQQPGHDSQQPLHHSQQPVHDSQQPQHHSQQHFHDSQQPQHNSQQPQHHSQQPQHNSQQPQHHSQQHFHDSQQPQHHSQQHFHDSQQPQHNSQQPQHNSQQPQHNSQQPQHHSQQPQHHSQQPQHHSQQHLHHSQQPVHDSQQPQHHSQQPQHHSQQPQHHSQQHLHHSQQPVHDSQQPQHHSQQPVHNSQQHLHHSQQHLHHYQQHLHDSQQPLHHSQHSIHEGEQSLHQSQQPLHQSHPSLHQSQNPQPQPPMMQSYQPSQQATQSVNQHGLPSLGEVSQKSLPQTPHRNNHGVTSGMYQQNSVGSFYQPSLEDYALGNSLLSSLFDDCDFQLSAQQASTLSQQFEQCNMVEGGRLGLSGSCFPGEYSPAQNSGSSQSLKRLNNCSRHDPIPNIILTAVDSPPGFSKEITSALSAVPGFEMDQSLGLEEDLNIEPLTLDGLNMLSDPYAPLTDPLVEDSFRSDRLQ